MNTERDTFQTPSERRTGIIPAVVAVLIVGVIAIAWWMGFPLMTKHDSQPSPLPVATATPDPLAARLSSAEEKLNGWTKEWPGVMDRMTQVEKSLGTNIRRARSEATALVEGVKREMGQSLAAIQSRLSGVESIQHETHDEIAQLQNDLAAARRDLEAIRQTTAQQTTQMRQIEQAQQSTQQAQQSTQNEVSGLQNRTLSTQNRVDGLSQQVDRRRIDFEVSKDRTEEVVPGIYLTIKHTDVGRQQVNGWLQIASDGRFLWLTDAGAQNPIAFSSRGDDRASQLVFTRVAGQSAAGYLLVPDVPVKTAAAAK
jgi:hypothetical protein